MYNLEQAFHKIKPKKSDLYSWNETQIILRVIQVLSAIKCIYNL